MPPGVTSQVTARTQMLASGGLRTRRPALCEGACRPSQLRPFQPRWQVADKYRCSKASRQLGRTRGLSGWHHLLLLSLPGPASSPFLSQDLLPNQLLAPWAPSQSLLWGKPHLRGPPKANLCFRSQLRLRERGEGGGGERASTNPGPLPVCALRLTWTTQPVKLPGGRQGRVRIEDREREIAGPLPEGWALLPTLSGLKDGRRRGERTLPMGPWPFHATSPPPRRRWLSTCLKGKSKGWRHLEIPPSEATIPDLCLSRECCSFSLWVALGGSAKPCKLGFRSSAPPRPLPAAFSQIPGELLCSP